MSKGNRRKGKPINPRTLFCLDEKKEKILRDIAGGMNKKEVSNKYGISIGNIVKMIDRNRGILARLEYEMNETRLGNIATFISSSDKKEIPTSTVMIEEIGIINEEKCINEEETNENTENKTLEFIEEKPSFSDLTEEIQKNSSRKRSYLSANMIASIVEDLKANVLSQREIASLYSVSPSTVSRIKKSHSIMVIDPVKVKQGEVNDSGGELINEAIENISEEISHKVEDVDNLLAVPIVDPIESNTVDILDKVNSAVKAESDIITRRKLVSSYFKIGMIRDRHDMPTDIYVFDDIDEVLMFDYKRQYDIAHKKISDLIKSNPVASNGLYLYVTGLCCALGTIMKVCVDLKINLTLLNYNNTDRTYHYQEILTKYGNDNSCLEQLLGIQCRNLYTFNCKASDIARSKVAYDIIEQHDPDDLSPKHKDVILFTNKSDAWQYYIAAIEAFPTSNIYFNRGEIINNHYFRKLTISAHERDK